MNKLKREHKLKFEEETKKINHLNQET